MVYLKSSGLLLLPDPQLLLGTSCNWLESNQELWPAPLVLVGERGRAALKVRVGIVRGCIEISLLTPKNRLNERKIMLS